MKNQPYKKVLQTIDNKQVVVNEITKDEPFNNSTGNRRTRRAFTAEGKPKYKVLTHMVTGEFIGKTRFNGNNRANTNKRKNGRISSSRNNLLA